MNTAHALVKAPAAAARASGTALCRIPADLGAEWRTADGTPVRLRPVLPRDQAALAQFIAGLSAPSRRARFPGAGPALPSTRLADLTDVDFERHVGLVVTVPDEGGERLIGEASFIADGNTGCADMALVIAGGWQRQGIGTKVVLALSRAAARRGQRWLRADAAADHRALQSMLRHCGFTGTPHPEAAGWMQLHLLLLPPFPGQ